VETYVTASTSTISVHGCTGGHGVGDVDAVARRRAERDGDGARLELGAAYTTFQRGCEPPIRDLLPALADGRLRVVLDRVFSFDDVPVAEA
jgi:hypothetical protein